MKILTPSFEINGITSMFSRCSLQCQMPQTDFQTQKGPKAPKSHSPLHGYLILQSAVLFGLVHLVILHANSQSNNTQVFCFQTSLPPKLFIRTYKLYSSFLLTSTSSIQVSNFMGRMSWQAVNHILATFGVISLSSIQTVQFLLLFLLL